MLNTNCEKQVNNSTGESERLDTEFSYEAGETVDNLNTAVHHQRKWDII